jgi:DNA-binding beta-propeller fold protein YncE
VAKSLSASGIEIITFESASTPAASDRRLPKFSPSVNSRLILFLIYSALALGVARGELAVTANDNKWMLVDGVGQVDPKRAPDTVAIVDLSASPPRLVAEIENVPSSVIGPPLSVAVSPDERFALVTAYLKVDPADPTKQTEDNRMSVIDLQATPPHVVATLEPGKGPSGVSINRAGTLALVANRGDGTVAVYSIKGIDLTLVGKVEVGNAASALGHVTFTPDGKQALVSRDGDNLLTFLKVDGTKVTLAGQDMKTGFRPYAVDVSRDGFVAVVSHVGADPGNTDTIGLIDLKAKPARLIDVVAVGQSAEGVKLSPDGQWCAVVLINGSNRPRNSPFYNDFGKLVLLHVENGKLRPAAEAPIGHWPQGAAFSADGRKIIVTNMGEKNLMVFDWDGKTLTDTGQRIQLKGGPVAIRTAEQ